MAKSSAWRGDDFEVDGGERAAADSNQPGSRRDLNGSDGCCVGVRPWRRLRQQQGGEGSSAVWLDSGWAVVAGDALGGRRSGGQPCACGGSGGFSWVTASSAAGGVEVGDQWYCLAGVGGASCWRRPDLHPAGAAL
ncbi:hypothetical protein Dimus_030627 [Dionaea muscipula]